MELEKLKAIAAGILGLSPAEISETADFSEVYGADSLEVFRIVTAIEEEFEAEFPEETALSEIHSCRCFLLDPDCPYPRISLEEKGAPARVN